MGERLELLPRDTKALIYNSKMSAKVDSALVQDGFQIYHHAFFFSKNGAWTVVQQGMNTDEGAARRYHWHSDRAEQIAEEVEVDTVKPNKPVSVVKKRKGIDFVNEPHAAITSEATVASALNLVAESSGRTRELSTDLVGAGFASLMKDITILRKHSSRLSKMLKVQNGKGEQLTFLKLEDIEFKHHPVTLENFSQSRYLEKILAKVTDIKPETYEKLVSIEGVGPKTVRALALVGEIIYGAKPSYEDPARYSFAHGGKDATPYPVDLTTYDTTISILVNAVRKSRMDAKDKDKALRRLERRPGN